MVAAALVVFPIAFTGFTVQRWEGALFVALYAGYVTYLVLNATGHQGLSGFTQTMVLFVLPLAAMAVITSLIHDLHRRTLKNDPSQPKQTGLADHNDQK